MVDEIRDANNNYIKFTYTKDAGQIYPSSIVYTGNGSTDGPFTVNFLTESRSDHYPSYKTGYSVTTSYRINEIDVLVSGTWVKKYLLTYGTGDNGVRSIVSQITEEGQDDSSNTITLPGTTASYATSSLQWTSVTSGWAGGGDGGSGITYIDVNGDGLTDDIYTVPGQAMQVFLNNGSTFVSAPSWHPQGLLNYANTLCACDTGWRIADVNGDGLPDLIYSYVNGNVNPSASSSVWINNGSDWVQDTSWTVPSAFGWNPVNGTSAHCGMEIVDLNGDGLPDLIGADSVRCGGSSATYINNGHGWTATTNWQSGGCGGGYPGSGLTYIDVNGDGLTDCVIATGGPGHAYLNNGSNFSIDSNWTTPGPMDSGHQGFRFGDVNGDGLPDIVRSWAMWNGGGYISSSTIYYNRFKLGI